MWLAFDSANLPPPPTFHRVFFVCVFVCLAFFNHFPLLSSTNRERTLENGSWDFSGTINNHGRTVCEMVRGRLGSSTCGVFSDGSVSEEERDRIEPVATPVMDASGLRGRPGKDGGKRGSDSSVLGTVGRHRRNYGSSSESLKDGVGSASRASNGGYETLAERGAMLADGWRSGMYERRSARDGGHADSLT